MIQVVEAANPHTIVSMETMGVVDTIPFLSTTPTLLWSSYKTGSGRATPATTMTWWPLSATPSGPSASASGDHGHRVALDRAALGRAATGTLRVDVERTAGQKNTSRHSSATGTRCRPVTSSQSGKAIDEDAVPPHLEAQGLGVAVGGRVADGGLDLCEDVGD